MKRLLLSLFIGISAASLGWASSFSFIELAEIDTSAVTDHELVIGITLIMLGIALVGLRDYLEPVVTIMATVATTVGLWPYDAFPQGKGFSPEYWSAVTVTTLIFIGMVAGAQSDALWARRRNRH